MCLVRVLRGRHQLHLPARRRAGLPERRRASAPAPCPPRRPVRRSPHMSDAGGETLSNLLREERRFPPPPELAATANATAADYERADADSQSFWAAAAARL